MGVGADGEATSVAHVAASVADVTTVVAPVCEHNVRKSWQQPQRNSKSGRHEGESNRQDSPWSSLHECARLSALHNAEDEGGQRADLEKVQCATGAKHRANRGGGDGLFGRDAESMKEKLRERMARKEYSVYDLYHEEGCWQAIARNQRFEKFTLLVISLNALWIWIDTDYNTAESLLDADPVFLVGENLFCSYFFFEWLVRFKSFRVKRDGLRDFWFVFDSILVFLMVGETWIMIAVEAILSSGGSSAMGDASILRMARLLRLARMARMARLLRAMPELMTLIKGIIASIRSVCLTAFLLLIILYVFGIALKQLAAGTDMGSAYFRTVPEAMLTLLIEGVFLDSMGTVLRRIGDDSVVCAVVFFALMFLAALTVMNMMIGVVCELVSTVAATEKEERSIAYVKDKIEHILADTHADENKDGQISKDEFLALIENPEAVRALTEVGVDVIGLMDTIDFIFQQETPLDGTSNHADVLESKTLSFEDFMALLYQLRGTNNATVKDIVDLRKYMNECFTSLDKRVTPSPSRQREDRTEHACGGAVKDRGDPPEWMQAVQRLDARVERLERSLDDRLSKLEELGRLVVDRLPVWPQGKTRTRL